MNLFLEFEPLDPFIFSKVANRGHFFGINLSVVLDLAILFTDSLVLLTASISRENDAKYKF